MPRSGWTILGVVVGLIAVWLLARASCADRPETEADSRTGSAREVEGGASPAPGAAESRAPGETAGPVGTGTIVGRILLADGSPAPGAAVRAMPDGDRSRARVVFAGEDGSFRFEDLDPARYVLTGAGRGYGSRLDEGHEPAIAEIAAGGEATVELRVQQLATVVGRVTGPDGSPVVGASVDLWCRAFLSPTGGAWKLETTTDGDGAFTVRNVTPDDHPRLVVEAEGLASTSRFLDEIRPGATAREDVTLERAVSLELMFVDAADGAPVTTAIVWITDVETDHLYSGGEGDAFHPDEEGRVRARSLRPHPVRLQVSAEGYVEIRERIVDPATSPGPVTVRLRRGETISGKVLMADGTPAPDVDVWAVRTLQLPSMLRDGHHRTRSGEDGAYVLTGLPSGKWIVGVFGDSLVPIVTTEAEAGAKDVLLRLPEGGTPGVVSFRVVDPDGEPVPLARSRTGHLVDGELQSSGGGTYHVLKTVEIENGKTAFIEVWDARDEARNRLPLGHVFLLVPANPPREIVVTMPPERLVTGTVLRPDGRPLEGAEVEVWTVPPEKISKSVSDSIGRVLCGAGGAFRVRGLGNERVRLFASAVGYVADPVEVPAGEADVRLRLVAEAPCEIRVLDEEGAPVRGAELDAAPLEGPVKDSFWEDVISATTDEEGRVVLHGLWPGRNYRLAVRVRSIRKDLLDREQSPWKPASREIRLERAFAIEGSVHLIDGDTPEAWTGRVEALRDGVRVGYARIDAEGRFRLDAVPRGRLTLRAHAGPGDRFRGEAEAEAGGGAVRIALAED